MRCAVVGHVEWTEFALVDHVPPPGQIAHATEHWSGPAGGGAVVAAQLAKLAGGCEFYTALGDDELGQAAVRRLEELGLTLHVEWFGRTRRAITFVDAHGERTITTIGEKLRPRAQPRLDGYDAAFFVAGEPDVLRAARAARFLAATPRELATLLAGAVRLDLLVGSGTDPGERYEGGLEVGVVVRTEGASGGTANGRRYAATPPPGPVVDAYGAGDSFAAALCFALARGDELEDALAFAARAGAAVVTGIGPYAAQLTA
ncbi:MAG TPA: PfkB family carbohydrate kinase [Gaiellaceae bacterium]|nr:PfkB family carbohydrate kinase [Gaiellaceae bacterium]